MLPLTPKQSQVRKEYWPKKFKGLLQLEATAIEARENVALAKWVPGSGVNSIAQSSDGKRIISGSNDRTASVWGVSKGTRIIGPLGGHQGIVWSVASCPDGTRIASGSQDGTIHIWDAHKGNLVAGPLRDHAGSVRALAFSPDGSTHLWFRRLYASHVGRMYWCPTGPHRQSRSGGGGRPTRLIVRVVCAPG